MTKYVLAKESDLPESLSKDEYVVTAPNFVEEVRACSKKKPKNGLLSPNYLREIAAAIGDKYLNEDFNTLVEVNVSKYRGIPITDDKSVSDVAVKMMSKAIPDILDRYVDYHIKKRPLGCKVIYFLGDHLQTGAFSFNGIDEGKLKEVPVFLGLKNKKIVGKPAVSDE